MKKLTAFLGGLLTCLALAGCSGKTTGGETTQESNPVNQQVTKSQVTIAKTALPEMDGIYFSLQGGISDYRHLKFSEGYAYGKNYDQVAGGYVIRRVDVSTGWAEDFCNPNGSDAREKDDETVLSVCCLDVTKDGTILALIGRYQRLEGGYLGEVKGFSLLEYDAEGQVLRNMELGEDCSIPNANVPMGMDMAVDGDGNVIVLSEDAILISAEGKFLGKIDVLEGTYVNGIVRVKSGEVWVSGFNEQGRTEIRKVNFKSGLFEEVPEELPTEIRGVGGARDEDLIAYTQEMVYAYHREQKEFTPLAEWASVGIEGTSVLAAYKIGEYIFVVDNDGEYASYGELAVISPRPADAPPKETIVLATIKKHDKKIQTVAARYNRSQNRYVVKIVEYGADAQSSLEYQDPANRLMMDVLGDDPPDLIDISHFIELSNVTPNLPDLVEQGYVEDLGLYLEKSAHLSKSQFEEKALALCTWQGKLAAIPQAYAIDALAVRQEDFGEGLGWSVWDLMAYDEAHPDMGLVNNCKAGHALSLCMTYNLDAFVDFESATARFDAPEFRQILEYAHSYPSGDAFFFFNDEEKLVSVKSIQGIPDLQRTLNLSFEGKGKIVGYPTMDGSARPRIRLSAVSYELAICGRSSHKDAAWEFIEYFLEADRTDYNQYLYQYGGIHVRKETLKKCMENLTSENGTLAFVSDSPLFHPEYPPYPLSEKEEELFYQLLDNAIVYDDRLDPVWSILSEETTPYFEGQKKLDAVIDVINQRVNLYLKEN